MSKEHTELPKHIAFALLADQRFSQCLDESLKTEELVEQFERLYGVARPRRATNHMVAMVDKVTGYTDDQYRKFFSVFIPFVYDCVYTRICENPILPEVNHG
ncbi:Uncharacterised protein [Serratia entomophila]|uniref:hypothetical protein n=1 Tax=Serratia entomophila TaxID=42906 RepID=UPI001F354EC1|nr:hypothetical protein [Serratia entomophila]UIW19295.1 hypothetical protein KHA73_04910 [Serratia entomophila]UIW19479.1 hypothetical protein KHA73_05880 [Serratia entomophila]CAI0819491.1 Uncharacterised protein [Serratia entomophila]CAI0822406.1 Uncharacterised protein [Serratia entomophila]CAI0843066.1 Uncharacterised protein [Serratia entomophila]